MAKNPAPAPVQQAQQTPEPENEQKPKAFKAFFNSDAKAPEVALFIDPKNPGLEQGRPGLYGVVGEKKVNVFVQPAGIGKGDKPYDAFMNIVEKGAKLEEGGYAKDKPLGTANFVATSHGPSLAINIPGQDTIWAKPRKELTDDLREKMGLDLQKVAELKSASSANKSPAQADAEPEPEAAPARRRSARP